MREVRKKHEICHLPPMGFTEEFWCGALPRNGMFTDYDRVCMHSMQEGATPCGQH
jgi:hypothetical protein